MQLTVKDIARLFDVPERKVRSWIRHEGLPAQELGGIHRFSKPQLLEWATARKMALPAEWVTGAGTGGGPLLSVCDALHRGGIVRDVVGKDKATVLREVVRRMALPARVDRDLMFRMLLARETLASTAVGDGIAFPHPRNPVVLHVPEAQVTLCYLKDAVSFGAIDDVPVYALFTLVSPTPKKHLQLLSRLSFVLRLDPFRASVMKLDDDKAIFAALRMTETGLRSGPVAGNVGEGHP